MIVADVPDQTQRLHATAEESPRCVHSIAAAASQSLDGDGARFSAEDTASVEDPLWREVEDPLWSEEEGWMAPSEQTADEDEPTVEQQHLYPRPTDPLPVDWHGHVRAQRSIRDDEWTALGLFWTIHHCVYDRMALLVSRLLDAISAGQIQATPAELMRAQAALAKAFHAVVKKAPDWILSGRDPVVQVLEIVERTEIHCLDQWLDDELRRV